MIPIDCRKSKIFSERTNKIDLYAPVLENYYKALMPTRRSHKVDALNDWCKKNIHLEKNIGGQEWCFKDVVCASSESLVKLKEFIDDLPETEKRNLVKTASYVVTTLYKDRLGKNGARRILENEMEVHVCPYCNRNLIYQLEKNGGFKTTCELDLFYSKGGSKGTDICGYSLLAVSFYNLIPSCQYCNGIKGEKELKAFYPHMSTWEEADKIRFTYYPNKVDYFTNTESFDIGMKIGIGRGSNRHDKVSRYKFWRRYDVIHDIDVLNIVEVYQNNKEDVQKLFYKKTIFTDEYISMLYEAFGEYFENKRELRDLMLDIQHEKDDVARTPLGKLKRDILNEVEITITSPKHHNEI